MESLHKEKSKKHEQRCLLVVISVNFIIRKREEPSLINYHTTELYFSVDLREIVVMNIIFHIIRSGSYQILI